MKANHNIYKKIKKVSKAILNIKEWQSIQSYNTNIEILQRGEQLNQLDLTGWLMLIKFANHKDMIAAFTRYEFLKAMKKSDSSRDYKWLRSFLNRISFTQFSIKMYENNRWIKYIKIRLGR